MSIGVAAELTAVTCVRKESSGKYLTNRATAEFSKVLYFPEAEIMAIRLKLSCLFILISRSSIITPVYEAYFSDVFRISAQIGCGPD